MDTIKAYNRELVEKYKLIPLLNIVIDVHTPNNFITLGHKHTFRFLTYQHWKGVASSNKVILIKTSIKLLEKLSTTFWFEDLKNAVIIIDNRCDSIHLVKEVI